MLDTMANSLPKLNPLERIPDMSHVLTSTFPEDAELTTVSEIPAFFNYSSIRLKAYRIESEFKE